MCLDTFTRSRTRRNCADPKFTTTIRCTFFFESRQDLRIAVYDADSSSRDLSKHDYLGDVNCTVADVVTARNQLLERALKDEKNPTKRIGTLRVQFQEIKDTSKILSLVMEGRKLDKKGRWAYRLPRKRLNPLRRLFRQI